MTRVDRVVQMLLKRDGQLFSEALGLDLRPGSASVLFQWLCASLLLGGRIRATAARQAAGALAATRLDNGRENGGIDMGRAHAAPQSIWLCSLRRKHVETSRRHGAATARSV